MLKKTNAGMGISSTNVAFDGTEGLDEENLDYGMQSLLADKRLGVVCCYRHSWRIRDEHTIEIRREGAAARSEELILPATRAGLFTKDSLFAAFPFISESHINTIIHEAKFIENLDDNDFMQSNLRVVPHFHEVPFGKFRTYLQDLSLHQARALFDFLNNLFWRQFRIYKESPERVDSMVKVVLSENIEEVIQGPKGNQDTYKFRFGRIIYSVVYEQSPSELQLGYTRDLLARIVAKKMRYVFRAAEASFEKKVDLEGWRLGRKKEVTNNVVVEIIKEALLRCMRMAREHLDVIDACIILTVPGMLDRPLQLFFSEETGGDILVEQNSKKTITFCPQWSISLPDVKLITIDSNQCTLSISASSFSPNNFGQELSYVFFDTLRTYVSTGLTRLYMASQAGAATRDRRVRGYFGDWEDFWQRRENISLAISEISRFWKIAFGFSTVALWSENKKILQDTESAKQAKGYLVLTERPAPADIQKKYIPIGINLAGLFNEKQQNKREKPSAKIIMYLGFAEEGAARRTPSQMTAQAFIQPLEDQLTRAGLPQEEREKIYDVFWQSISQEQVSLKKQVVFRETLTLALSQAASLGVEDQRRFVKAVSGAYAHFLEAIQTIIESLNTSYLRWTAAHDALTGLLNRGGYDNYREECIAKNIKNRNRNFGQMYLDIDHMKFLNDVYGHSVVDEILATLGDALNVFVEKNGASSKMKIGRVGGDEIAVFLNNVTLAQMEVLAKLVYKTISNFVFQLQISLDRNPNVKFQVRLKGFLFNLFKMILEKNEEAKDIVIAILGIDHEQDRRVHRDKLLARFVAECCHGNDPSLAAVRSLIPEEIQADKSRDTYKSVFDFLNAILANPADPSFQLTWGQIVGYFKKNMVKMLKENNIEDKDGALTQCIEIFLQTCMENKNTEVLSVALAQAFPGEVVFNRPQTIGISLGMLHGSQIEDRSLDRPRDEYTDEYESIFDKVNIIMAEINEKADVDMYNVKTNGRQGMMVLRQGPTGLEKIHIRYGLKPKKKILIVDDEESYSNMLQRLLLKKYGWHSVQAHIPQASAPFDPIGFSILLKESDACILDINMPHAKDIMAALRDTKLGVIIHSGFGQQKDGFPEDAFMKTKIIPKTGNESVFDDIDNALEELVLTEKIK